ncbi:hypothetical protein GCM10010413_50350 [Promicromonospora sukumoe]
MPVTIDTSSSPAPNGYGEFIADLKRRVRTTQYRAVRAANTEVLRLYWSVGRDILDRQRNEGWGTKIVDQISADMRREFPGQRGWSRSNIKNMRRFAEVWPASEPIGQQAVGQLPWGHVVTLIERLGTADEREWYAAKAVQNGWSRASLEFEIKTDLRKRLGSAPSNFATTLDAVDSDLAQQAVKDSYVFEHLDPDEHVAERDRERVLIDRIQDTLLELGRDMAFVGRQYRIEVGGDEFFVDLLFFHVTQLRYVVVELKVGKFQPAHMGQIGTYVAMVDGEVRDPDLHAKTVGILLCTERNDATLDYALAGTASPVAVALYEGLTPAERAALPSPGELEAVIEEEIQAQGPAAAPAPDQVPV